MLIPPHKLYNGKKYDLCIPEFVVPDKLGWFFNNGLFLICLTHSWCCLGDVVVQILWASSSIYLSAVQTLWKGLACWIGFAKVVLPQKSGKWLKWSYSSFLLQIPLSSCVLTYTIFYSLSLSHALHFLACFPLLLSKPHLFLAICFENVWWSG